MCALTGNRLEREGELRANRWCECERECVSGAERQEEVFDLWHD